MIFLRILKTTGKKKMLSFVNKIFFVFSIYEPFICASTVLVFPKFDPLTASGMVLCFILDQNVKLYYP